MKLRQPHRRPALGAFISPALRGGLIEATRWIGGVAGSAIISPALRGGLIEARR